MSAQSRLIRIIVSFSVSVFFLYLTFFIPRLGSLFNGDLTVVEALFGHGRFNLSGLGQALASAKWSYICLAAVLFVLTLVVRAWRWQLMLRPVVSMRFMEVFGALSIGYMANNVLPLRMGELYRAQVVYQLSGVRRSSAFGCVVLERLVDSFFMIPFVGLAFLLYPLPASMRSGALLLGLGAFSAMAFLIWLAVDRARALKLAGYLLVFLPAKTKARVLQLLDTFTQGMLAVGRSDMLLRISGFSIIMWVGYTYILYLVLVSFGLTKDIPLIYQDKLATSLVLLVITTIGIIVPAAPGAVGTYHGMTVLGLSLFGVPGEQAASFAILLHALNYIPLTTLGLIFFWKYGLSFKGSRGLEEEFAGPSEGGQADTGPTDKQTGIF